MTDGYLSDGWAMVMGVVLLPVLAVAAFYAGELLNRWDAEKTRSEALRKMMGIDGHD